jgi:hypothetical protein
MKHKWILLWGILFSIAGCSQTHSAATLNVEKYQAKPTMTFAPMKTSSPHWGFTITPEIKAATQVV